MSIKKYLPSKTFGILTIIAGIIGWFASFELLTEKIKTLEDPSHVPNCNISVLVTCGLNMNSEEGSVFGFPNAIIGVSLFIAPIIMGILVLAKAELPRWFWTCYQIGLTLAYIFICWLSYISIFKLGTLCPWCMIVWTVTIPLFWGTLINRTAAGDIYLPEFIQKVAKKLNSWIYVFVIINYVYIATLAQINLDWINNL